MTRDVSALCTCKHMRQRIVKWQAGVSARNDEVGVRGRLLSASVGRWTQAQALQQSGRCHGSDAVPGRVVSSRIGGRNSANVSPSAAHASFYLLTSPRISLPVLLVFCCIMKVASGYECGGFLLLRSLKDNRTITTPNYPSNYPNFTRCIWLVETSTNYLVSITFKLEAEKDQGVCTDILQFRDGGPKSEILKEFCVSVSSYTVQSTGPWMYIAFRSKGQRTFTGFKGKVTIELAKSPRTNISRPYSACPSFQFSCSNKMCVSMSYRCDGYYDCGCGQGCDEDGCGGLPVGEGMMILYGVSIGAVTFVLVAVLGVQLEKKRNWETLNTKVRFRHKSITPASNVKRFSLSALLCCRSPFSKLRDVTSHR